MLVIAPNGRMPNKKKDQATVSVLEVIPLSYTAIAAVIVPARIIPNKLIASAIPLFPAWRAGCMLHPQTNQQPNANTRNRNQYTPSIIDSRVVIPIVCPSLSALSKEFVGRGGRILPGAGRVNADYSSQARFADRCVEQRTEEHCSNQTVCRAIPVSAYTNRATMRCRQPTTACLPILPRRCSGG